MGSQLLQQSLGTLRSLAGRGDYMANLLIKVFDELLVGQKGGITARFASTANRAALSGLANTGLDGTPIEGDIVLLKDQTDAKQNGLYIASAGTWSRYLDDNGAVLIGPNMLIPVREGATLADKVYQVTSNSTIIGTDNITIAELGGGAAAPTGRVSESFTSVAFTADPDIPITYFRANDPGTTITFGPGTRNHQIKTFWVNSTVGTPAVTINTSANFNGGDFSTQQITGASFNGDEYLSFMWDAFDSTWYLIAKVGNVWNFEF